MKALVKPSDKQLPACMVEMPLCQHSGNIDNVLLKVLTVGLCRTDLYVASGLITIEKDIVLGHEFAAIVEYDPLNILTGQKVGVNPLYVQQGFMGLNFDGALCEYIEVPRKQVVATNEINNKLVAYLEPVAASMAILDAADSTLKGAVYGNNRIAQLTYMIAKQQGLNITQITTDDADIPAENHRQYDYIIETVFEEKPLLHMMQMLKDNGKLIVKSRKRTGVSINASLMVEKSLTLQAVNYYDFAKAMTWLENNAALITPLLGQSFAIDDWQSAFIAAEQSETQKIFIHFAE